MVKNILLRFCAVLFCMFLPVCAMERQQSFRPSPEAVIALERIHFYIFADRYQDASTVVRYAQSDPTFVALIKQDRDIEQLCNDHVELLQLVRQMVIVKRGMMPTDFFQVIDGFWRDDELMSVFLQKTNFRNYVHLVSLIFLVHQLHILRSGIDYFEPIVAQKVEEDSTEQPSVQLPGAQPIAMPLTKAQQEAYRALGIDIIAIIRKQQETKNLVDIAAIIKHQYHALALRIHPDKNHEPGTAENFKHIQAAYQLLTNPS